MSNKLVLTIEMDDLVVTDEWIDAVKDIAEAINESFEYATLVEFLDNMSREDVHVVFCGVPGEKSLNDDFEVYVKPGRIVGANIMDESVVGSKELVLIQDQSSGELLGAYLNGELLIEDNLNGLNLLDTLRVPYIVQEFDVDGYLPDKLEELNIN